MPERDRVKERRTAVRRMRVLKMTASEIRSAIEVKFSTPEKKFEYKIRTYNYDLAALQREDQEWAQKEVANLFLSTYRESILVLEEQERKLTLIAESAERDYDKIMARNKIIDAEMQRLNLITEGLVVLEYDKLKEMAL